MSTNEPVTRSAAAKKETAAKKDENKEANKVVDIKVVTAPPPAKPSISKTADDILMGVIKASPYYNPIHEAIKKPILQLLKDLGVRPPGGDGVEADPIPHGK